MARFRTDGLDDLIDALDAMEESTDDLVKEMLFAGADIVKVCWKWSAAFHGLHDSGDMINSIGYPHRPKRIGDIKSIDIYPQGKDRKGVRNVEKAFILHYGSSSIKATYWVDDADDMAGPMVERRLRAIMDDWLKKHGLL